MNTTKRLARLSAALVLGVLSLPGCSSSYGGDEDPITGPVIPSRTTVFSQGFSVGSAFGTNDPDFGFQDVNIPATGDVEVTFDWTFASSDLDLVVTRLDCPDGVAAYNGNCAIFGEDKDEFRKPARVLFRVTSPGLVRVWVYNFTTRQESGVMNVYLTR